MTSHFLSKGHKMLNVLVNFFLKIFETLKTHISGTKTDILIYLEQKQISTNGKKLSFRYLIVFHISQ